MTLFRGPAAPENKIHDFHTPIAPNGLYWVAVIPDGGLEISADGRRAELEVPSIGFRWKSDPLATSSAAFGVIGEEKNGRYFTP